MKLIILDRDGVVNRDSDAYVRSADEWIPIPGSLEAIARLNHNGYRVVIATNQSGLARGLFTIDDLNAMHRKMHRELARLGGQVDAIFFCPHGPEDGCNCRKPLLGLYEQIRQRMQQDLDSVPVIGDSMRDLESARKVRASPILVLTGKGERTLASFGAKIKGIPVYADLSAAVGDLVSV